jgi:hypothetical protein
MSFLRTVPADRAVRPSLVEDDAPGLDLDGVGAATMLAMALAPTVFVLVATLQMLGVHAL